MKSQCQSTHPTVWVEVEEVNLWWLLGFEDDSQNSKVQSRIYKSTTLIVQVAWTPVPLHLREMH